MMRTSNPNNKTNAIWVSWIIRSANKKTIIWYPFRICDLWMPRVSLAQFLVILTNSWSNNQLHSRKLFIMKASISCNKMYKILNLAPNVNIQTKFIKPISYKWMVRISTSAWPSLTLPVYIKIMLALCSRIPLWDRTATLRLNKRMISNRRHPKARNFLQISTGLPKNAAKKIRKRPMLLLLFLSSHQKTTWLPRNIKFKKSMDFMIIWDCAHKIIRRSSCSFKTEWTLMSYIIMVMPPTEITIELTFAPRKFSGLVDHIMRVSST